MTKEIKDKIEAAAQIVFGGESYYSLLTIDREYYKDVLAIGAEIALQGTGWTSVDEALPDLIEGKDYSENVFAVVENHKQLMVMNYGFTHGENEAGETVYGGVWSNCYGHIDGDGEWDDEYKVTFWMPLPSAPTPATNT